MPTPPINLLVIFTWDVSLQIWREKGLLQREVLYYTRLAERGIYVTFLTWGDQEDEEIGKTLHPNIHVVPIYRHIRAPRSKILRGIASPCSLWIARSAMKRADIIKTNQMWGGWIAVLAKFIFSKPLLVRTGFELYRFSCLQNKGLIRKLIIWLISWLTYKSADLVYLATEDDKSFVIKTFSVPLSRMNVRPNWIDTEAFSPQTDVVSPEHKNRILFVGRLNEQKNLPMLIDAIAGSPYGADFYGTGELQSHLNEYAKQKGADVKFMGMAPNDTLPSIYSRYPVFALLSHFEGNPKALLEAMACECAVLGTDVEGINSVIVSGKNGLLCEKNTDSIKFSLNKLMSTPSLRKELGQEARKTIVETQSIGHLIRMELADYTRLLETKQDHPENENYTSSK